MSTDKIIKFKSSLKTSFVVGIFCKTTDSAMIEAAGIAGLDFVILDCEHGPANLETMEQHVRAALLSDVFPVVRVKGVEAHSIGSALDIGALGIQVPNISDAEQVKDVVRAARFHPQGMRGACKYVRAAEYGKHGKDSYFQDGNQAVIIIQVEGIDGFKNLDRILEVDGFDVLFIGTYDLSQAVGLPGQVNAPQVLDLIEEIYKKAKAKEVVLGIFTDTPDNLAYYHKKGISYLSYSVDINLFREACVKVKNTIEAL